MTYYVLAISEWLNFSGVFSYFSSIKSNLEHAAKVRKTINELSKLTDRELNDIGITRGDIWAIAHEDASFKRFADTNSNLRGWV